MSAFVFQNGQYAGYPLGQVQDIWYLEQYARKSESLSDQDRVAIIRRVAQLRKTGKRFYHKTAR